MASDMGQKITPDSSSLALKVVATDTESNTASTAIGIPDKRSCSNKGMPNFSYVFKISGSTSSKLCGPSPTDLGAE